MKFINSVPFWPTLIAVLTLTFCKAPAQELRPATRQTWTEQGEVLAIGQVVKYKTSGSPSFVKGRIAAISDTTFSFQTGTSGTVVTIPYKELEAFKITTRRDHVFGNIAGGVGLMLLGGLVIVGTEAYVNSSGSSKVAPSPGPHGGDIVGAAIMTGGIALIVVSSTPKKKTLMILSNAAKP